MINFIDVTGESIKNCNPIWPQIPDSAYKALINVGFR